MQYGLNKVNLELRCNTRGEKELLALLVDRVRPNAHLGVPAKVGPPKGSKVMGHTTLDIKLLIDSGKEAFESFWYLKGNQ